MKKKFLALFTAVAMTVSLAACGGSDSGGNGSSTPAGTTATAGDNGSADNAGASGEITKITMAFPTWTGAPADTAKIQDAMNEITRDSIGIEVELQISDFASYNQNMTLSLSGGEPMDIISTMGFAYGNAVQQGFLLNLEENDLLATYGSGIIEAVGQEYIDACRVSGVLYGVPNNRDMAQGHGCAAVAAEYLDGIGYAYDKEADIVKITLEELNDIYAQLHEKYPDIEVYRPSAMSMQQFSNVDTLGGNVFGVLLNYGAELKVENLFASDFYMDYCERMYDYNQKGYISQDASTDTTAVTELVKAGALMSYTTGGKPGIKAQESNLCGRPMVIFQTMEDFVASTSVASFPWALPLSCTNPQAAMTYLNELYTNADLANTLAWGIEGEHYKINADGLADYADGVDGTTSGWNHSMGWLMPNQFITHVWTGNDPDLWNQIKTFNDEAVKSAASGFTFDTSNVATEITAVQNVYNEYQTSIEYGFVEPAAAIEEMCKKLDSAGFSKIIEEKQAQLDAWAEANK